MPRLSDTMEEGTLVKWLKQVGDTVAIGDVLAEVETDKATMELEAFDAGVLSEIRVAEGEAAPVGAVIAVLGGAGEQRPAASPAASQKGATQEPPAKEPPAETPPTKEPPVKEPPAKEPPAKAPPVEEPPREKPPVKEAPARPSGATAAPASAGAPPRATPPDAGAERVRASPRARRLASERGVDLTSVRGSGPGGRVLEQDLGAASASRPAPTEPRAAPGPAPGAGERRVPLGKIRRTTAQRMAAATREVPHFYASSEIDVETLVQVKDELRGQGGEWQRITVTHLLLKAVGLALRAVPDLNASWADDAVLLHEAVNIGLAVATDDGLLVPVVRNCDTEPLAELVRRAQGLVERVRSRRIAGDDLVGGTFTISNLGMYPVSQFAAVVNPPHAGILAVGAIRVTPVVRGKGIVPGQVMAVTLSCDHRVVDGVIAGRFLDALKTRLEEPRTLLD